MVDEFLPLTNLRGTKVGSLHVKLYWFDAETRKDPKEGNNLANVSIFFIFLKFVDVGR